MAARQFENNYIPCFNSARSKIPTAIQIAAMVKLFDDAVVVAVRSLFVPEAEIWLPAEPEIVITRVLLQLGTKFRRRFLCFRGQALE